jgi:hypothetical protein
MDRVFHLRLADRADAARAPLPNAPVAAARASVSGVSSVVSSRISASSWSNIRKMGDTPNVHNSHHQDMD